MRKVITYFTIISAVSSSVIPLTACTFNFYGEKAAQTAIKSFANQTSNIVKSLVLGKEKSVDTAQTINDIMAKYPNSSIDNASSGRSFNDLGDFIKNWGENGKISFDHFDPTDGYFTASGQGSLTKKVNSYRQTNSTLATLKQVTSLSIVDNKLLFNQVQNNKNIKNAIFNFFNNAKNDDPAQINPAALFLKNLVLGKDWTSKPSKPDEQSFQKNLIDPISFLLDYLVDNKWSADQPGTTPSNATELKNFMDNWIDSDKSNNIYSQWHDDHGKWNLGDTYYNNWNAIDYNFYRAGVLINWIFYKIGKDYQIVEPETKGTYKDRYLGDIISDHISLLPTPGIDDKKLLADIKQYLPYFLQNPMYIITAIQAIIPILKYFGLNGDVSHGTKNLTFGNAYPSDTSKESYNFKDVINNIKNLITDPEKLKAAIKALIGWAPNNTVGKSFLYDVKINVSIITSPLPELINSSIIPEDKKNELVNGVVGFLNSATVTDTINSISDIYETWIKQYNDKGTGINISLDALRNFLVGQKGLLNVIKEQLIIPVLYPILKNDPKTPFDDKQYYEFYKGLGGQIPPPGQSVPMDFTPGSILDILKTNIGNPDTPLGQISAILFGNSNKNILGIFDNVIESNTKWIQNNYEGFFDANNQKIGATFNQVMNTETVNNIIISTLQYNFSFTINNKTYLFFIKCISHDNASSYRGTKTFRFTNIDLISINTSNSPH